MSLGEVMSNVFSRQRARMESERVEDQETEDVMVNQVRPSSSSPQDEIQVTQDVENGSGAIPDGVPVGRETSSGTAASSTSSRSASREEGSPPGMEDGEPLGGESLVTTTEEEPSPDEAAERLFATNNNFTRNTMTLAELEEQRELSRRRSSACVLLAVFVLFRLWIECLQTKEPPLLLLCLLGTAWTARWIRYNQEREEELDRRIEAYLQNNNNNSGGNEEIMERSDYARLSFQAQLALAIMESQRHMMEGGYGNPDGLDEQTPGVSDEAKTRWKNFQWNGCVKGDKKGEYGAVPTKGLEHVACEDVDQQCSICLCEYEEDETLVRLPCQHVFHSECIDSWTRNHTKCPLCNLDLETVEHDGPSDSIV